MKYRISVTDENYRRMEWYEMMSEWVKTFATKQEAREQIAEWREFDEAEGNFYHYGIDEVFEHQYKLEIHYRNGEVDDYYYRLAFRHWDTDAPTCDEAEEEMRCVDPQTFDTLEACENVDYYEVVKLY